LQASPAAAEIPVIDLSRLGADGAVIAEIGRACREIGFFYVAQHGVSEALVADMFRVSAAFFALPEAVKAEIAIEKSACHRGWFRVGGENLDPEKQRAAGDLKEGVKIGRDLRADHPLVAAGTPLHGANQWPRLPADFRAVAEAYYAAMVRLGTALLDAFGQSVGVAPGFFEGWLTAPMTTLGPLHYPPQRGRITQAQIGAGAHTDYGCLTILAQDDAGGLQVRGADGAWIDAPPIPGTFVVNIGDMMERWTNGIFRSTLHRVVNVSGKERYSLPFFFDPDFHAPVECLGPCVGDGAKYAATTAGRHLIEKIDASFAYHKGKSK
jgi:isopenicillin N synthase-like dioxygenase